MKTLKDRFVDSFAADPGAKRGRRRRSQPGPPDFGGVIYENSSVLTFVGLTLGVFVSRKFFVIPMAVALTLAQEFGKGRLLPKAGRRGPG